MSLNPFPASASADNNAFGPAILKMVKSSNGLYNVRRLDCFVTGQVFRRVAYYQSHHRTLCRVTRCWIFDPADGQRLLTLECQLVRANTWMADANDLVEPRIGLPELPVVDLPDDESVNGLHWKTAFLTQWQQGAHSPGSTTK